jgi:preprotein translocase subunit SecG
MKKTTLILATIVLLMSIFPSVVATPQLSDTHDIPASSYLYIGSWNMKPDDKLSITVQSSPNEVDVYVMTQDQLDNLLASGGSTWNYEFGLQDIFYCNRQFNAEFSDDYYVVIYNKGFTTVHVDFHINYNANNPFGLNLYTFWSIILNIMLFVVLPVAIVIAIVLPIVIHHKRKKKRIEVSRSSSNLSLETHTRNCTNCGSPLKEGATFCENCGTQIK